MTGRILIMLVVLTTVAASRQPVLAQAPEQTTTQQARSNWIDRLAVGLSRSITRGAMLQRIAFNAPRPTTTRPLAWQIRPIRQELPDPSHCSLPPPAGC
jgi:hypothetical protein